MTCTETNHPRLLICQCYIAAKDKQILELEELADAWHRNCVAADHENERLRAALQYYADYMNYSVDYDTSDNGFVRRCVLYGDIEERNESSGLAGRRARTALSQKGTN